MEAPLPSSFDPSLTLPELDQREIETLETSWNAALFTNDISWFRKNLDATFTYVMCGGAVIDKQTFISTQEHGERKVFSIKTIDSNIKRSKSTAIVSAMIDIEAEFKGIKFVGPIRLTRVWLRNEYQWMLTAFHATDARLQAKWETTVKKP